MEGPCLWEGVIILILGIQGKGFFKFGYLIKGDRIMYYFKEIVLMVIVLVSIIGCVKNIKTSTPKKLGNQLAVLILAVDSVTPDYSLTKIVCTSISKAIRVVEEIKDGEFELSVAMDIIKDLKVYDGMALFEVLKPSQRRILEILIEDVMVDLKPVEGVLPEVAQKLLNQEFAQKFVDALNITLKKLSK